MNGAVLALDFSSRRLSAALGGSGGLREASLELERFDGVQAVALLESLFGEAGVPPAALTEIRVGVGPGNFSGIRFALAWALGAAAPDGIPVRAFSSLDLLTARLREEERGDFVILGDARRGLWWGREAAEGSFGALQTLAPSEWIIRTAGRPVFSPDAARLGAVPSLVAAYPDAGDLLRLELPGVEPVPIYLHAAVAE